MAAKKGTMTFSDDFLRIEFETGRIDILCSKAGVTWPPPLEIRVGGFRFLRVGMSELTDAQREKIIHVCRGALYMPVPEQEPKPHNVRMNN